VGSPSNPARFVSTSGGLVALDGRGNGSPGDAQRAFQAADDELLARAKAMQDDYEMKVIIARHDSRKRRAELARTQRAIASRATPPMICRAVDVDGVIMRADFGDDAA
jgi:ketosteroid isomerase-like protein